MEMPRTVNIRELAKVIRSKNAGPFRITLDLFFEDYEKYEAVKKSGLITKKTIAEIYRVPESHVLGIYFVDNAKGIKITLLRNAPSGSSDDTDVYGAQQHAPLLTLNIPIEEE